MIKDEGVKRNATKSSSLLEDGLFEGDLAITEDLVHQHYNFSSLPGGEKDMKHEDEGVGTETTYQGRQKFSKRAARACSSRWWKNGIVSYQFHPAYKQI